MSGLLKRKEVDDLNPLENLSEKILAKYRVSRTDSELAVDWLEAFLDAKERWPGRLLIVSQIVDWAWHEIIVETSSYRNLCLGRYGKFIHHVATQKSVACGNFSELLASGFDVQIETRNSLVRAGIRRQNLDAAFAETKELLINTYHLKLPNGKGYWTDAGWNDPKYALRVQPSTALGSFDKYGRDRSTGDHGSIAVKWLYERLSIRYGISFPVARKAVDDYVRCFLDVGAESLQEKVRKRGALVDFAWQEHILWTDRYARDCARVWGRFCDRSMSS